MSPQPERKNLKDLTLGELKSLVKDLKEPPYRAVQLYTWLFKRGVASVALMSNVSKKFLAIIKQGGYFIGAPRIIGRRTSVDGTVKLLFSLEDDKRIESVLIPDGKRLTLCVSTQAGCALGCRFCATGMLGPGRNLTLSELTGQVHSVASLVKEGLVRGFARITNVVLMGMGEPLLNYEEVVKFLKVLTDPKGMGFSARRVTVSTAGIVPAIKKLGKETRVNLAVSLNATTDRARNILMPVNKRYPISLLIPALRRYPLPQRKYITIEYVLIRGVNDSTGDARNLAELLRGIPCKINLIPFNPFPGSLFERPDEKSIEAFKGVLRNAHYNVLIRVSRGSDIEAACGQLSAGYPAMESA